MTGFVKTKNAVINTDNDKLTEYRNQKRQLLKEREIQQTMVLLKEEIEHLKLGLSEIKAILNKKGIHE